MVISDRLHHLKPVLAGLVCAAAMLLVACGDDEGGGGGAATDGEVVSFRAATAEGIGTPMANAFDEYMQRLETCSDGRLQGEHFPAEQLGAYPDLIDGVNQGTYEMSTGSFATPGQIAPELAVPTLGYLIRGPEHEDRVIEELSDELSRISEEKTGATIAAIGTEGPRSLIAREPVRSLEGLAGIKMRVPEEEIPVGLWSGLGARPTPIPSAELYSALQTGVVDAAEQALAAINSLNFYEPAPHLTLSEHWYNLKPVWVNTEWLEGLPEESQQCIGEEAEAVFTEERTASRQAEDEIVAELESKGAKIYELPDIEQWQERGEAYAEEYVVKHPEAADLVEQIRALRPE